MRALPGGGVPGRARAAARGGRGVPRPPSLLLLLLPPPRPPPPLLPSSCAGHPLLGRGWGGVGGTPRAQRAWLGWALPLAEAHTLGRGGGGGGGGGGSGRLGNFAPLCAPPRRRRAGSIAFSNILTQGGRSVRRKLLTLICPTAHPLAHLMPEPRVGEGEEPTQPR